MTDRLLQVEDVQRITGRKPTYCYELIRKLNSELEENGYITCKGRIPASYLYERMNIEPE